MSWLDRLLGGRRPELEIEQIERRFMAARVRARPFPFMIVDDVLPPAVLDAVRRHWPDDPAFVPEVPGNYVCDPRRLSADGAGRLEYWSTFARTTAPMIASSCLGRFAEWVIARHGDDFRDVMVSNFSLMRSDIDYPGHPCHAHHWHDPMWIATLLLYVDEDAGGQQGTTINGFQIPTGSDPAAFAASFAALKPTSSKWHGATWNPEEDTFEVETSDYEANRAIAFMDSPISYHSVKPIAPGATGSRHLIRMHLGAPWSECEHFYGVPYEEYRKLRELPIEDPRVVGWLRRDIACMWETAPSMSLDERRLWASRLSFDF